MRLLINSRDIFSLKLISKFISRMACLVLHDITKNRGTQIQKKITPATSISSKNA